MAVKNEAFFSEYYGTTAGKTAKRSHKTPQREEIKNKVSRQAAPYFKTDQKVIPEAKNAHFSFSNPAQNQKFFHTSYKSRQNQSL